MKYTRKDFERIATEIRHHKKSEREGCIQVWVARFKKSNPLFDETKFRAACGDSMPKATKKFDVNKELDKVEDALTNLGCRLSEPFHARAKELIVQLSKFKGVKIKRLLMGRGGYSLDATLPFIEYFKGKAEKGDHELELELQFDTGRNCWLECYENANPGICAVCSELNDVLHTLTHTHYLQIFDIDPVEMKKLLKKS